jgi:hypothetical protein
VNDAEQVSNVGDKFNVKLSADVVVKVKGNVMGGVAGTASR